MQRPIMRAIAVAAVAFSSILPTRAQTLDISKAERLPVEFKLKANDVGTSVLTLSAVKATARAIKLTSKGDTAPAPESGGREVRFQEWYVFSGTVDIRFPRGSSDVSVTIADAPFKPSTTSELRPITAEPKANSTTVNLSFFAGTGPRPKKITTEEEGTIGTSDDLTYLLSVAVGILALVGIALAWTWYRGRRELASGRQKARSQEEPRGPEQARPPYTPVVRRYGDAIERPSTADRLNESPASQIDNTTRLERSVEQLHMRLDEMALKFVGSQGHENLQRQLEEFGYLDEQRQIRAKLAQISEERRTLCEQFTKATTESSSRMAVFSQQIEGLGRMLADVRTDATKRLDTSLGLLASLYTGQLPTSKDEQALVAQKLEEELTRFFRQSVPPRDGLIARRDRSRRFFQLANEMLVRLGSAGLDDIDQRLAPGVRETAMIEKEISGLLGEAQAQRLCLDFQVDLSSSTASRELLRDAIASGLRRQVQKLAEPLDHFDRRLEAVSLSLAQNAADVLDLKGDMTRRDTTLQSAFEDLVKEAGLEVIDPAPRTDYVAAEHNVVQMIPRILDAKSRQVARTAIRGFRRDGTIVRKASVIIYE
jgi:molecular chaperone GrpE (heat shock protein)